MSKNLYILVSNGGDGSYGIEYILDDEVLAALESAADEDRIDPMYCPGYDGDGFHYDTIQVPDDATAESLGISVLTMEHVKDLIDEDE